MKAAAELAGQVGVKPACDALGVCGATFYRRLRPMTGHQQPSPTPARALSEKEQDEVFDILCSQRFVDRSPAEVVATLVDEGVYLCSERTMYRVLASRAAVQERRPQRTHPEYKKPELMATGPNQVWSWDITRLLGPKKWSYFYLYVILDIFSRYAVGWMVADRENSALAGRLIQQSCLKYGVQPRVLTLHSDRGAPMTSQCTAQLLADLGVTRSLSLPRVSDDNPFSEAQFKTLKYHPSFPGRFDDQGQAKNFCRSFFPWYNAEHRHGGISMLTPEQLHFGLADEIIARREAVLRAAWAAHPDRFVSGEPKPKPLPEAVWINPPTPTLTTQEIALQLIPPSVSQPLTGSETAARPRCRLRPVAPHAHVLRCWQAPAAPGPRGPSLRCTIPAWTGISSVHSFDSAPLWDYCPSRRRPRTVSTHIHSVQRLLMSCSSATGC